MNKTHRPRTVCGPHDSVGRIAQQPRCATAAQRFGELWRSYDFNSSKGTGNMFKDPMNLHPNGGEMIFNLPNGLQGYFVTNAIGTRVQEAPTGIVTDKFAEDKTVRNGLSCMRCHDQGIKGFRDNIRQAIDQLFTTKGRDAGIDPREIRHFFGPETNG